jgi:surface carbohydrate biosynthesis protein
MSKVDIVIIVDSKWRDLPGMAALATWLEEGYGLTTMLIPYTKWFRTLHNFRPKVLVVTHMNGARSRAIAYKTAALGTRLVVIHTEGRPNNTELMEYLVGPHMNVKGVDLWFTWSETVRDVLLSRHRLPEDRIVVGGVHRFDFYRPVLNKLLLQRTTLAERYGLDASRPIVSWSTNFTTAKYHLRNRDFISKDWKDLGVTKFATYQRPVDFAKKDFEAREQMLVTLRDLLRARPGIQVLLKPHPMEDHDRYQSFIQEFRNEFRGRLTFIASEYIWDVLNCADAHIHRLCTTGVEAWLLNVPSIEHHSADYYGWSMQLGGAASEAARGNDVVSDTDALIERVDYYLNGGTPSAEQLAVRDSYIKKWLYQVDGRRCMTHARILAQVASETKRTQGPSLDFSLLKTLAREQARMYFNEFRKPSKGADRLGQVDCRIAPDDAEIWRQRVREVLIPHIQDWKTAGAGAPEAVTLSHDAGAAI